MGTTIFFIFTVENVVIKIDILLFLESKNINSQSDDSNHNRTDAWFKSMVERTSSKNKVIDMKGKRKLNVMSARF